MSLVLKYCGADNDKFIPLDMMKYEIYNVVTTEVPNVILMDNDILLSSICSAICSKKDNSSTCIGFSSDITTQHTCTLYSEVEFLSNINVGPAMNVTEEIYLR